MRAHRMKVVVTEGREISAKLPTDFPCGSAELIVLADADGMTPVGPWYGRRDE